MRKKILIISNYFYPINSPRSFRTTELVKELARQNHDVTVLIPRDKNHHDDFESKYGVKIKDLGQPKWVVKKQKNKKKQRLLKRITLRIQDQFFFYPRIELMFLVAKAIKKEGTYDLLISIASPHSIHWGVSLGLRSKNNITKTWVADCGDPFMKADNLQYKRLFYFKYLEKKFCRKANFITIPFEGAKDGYYKEFHSKIQIIPQGFKFNEITKCQDSLENKDNVLSFAYAGSLVPKRRDPKELLDYLIGRKIDFRFYIYSKSHTVVKQYALKYPDKVILKSYTERTKLLNHLSNMDFVVNFENVGSTQLPSKLIDYAILEKPILSIKYGFLNKIVVNQFLERNYAGAYIVKDLDQYRIETIAKKFIKLSS